MVCRLMSIPVTPWEILSLLFNRVCRITCLFTPAVIVVEIALKNNDIIIAGNSKNMSDVEFDSSTIESGLR